MPDSLTPLNTKAMLVSQVTCFTGQLPRTWGMAALWVSEKTPTALKHLELLLPSAHYSEKLRASLAQGSMEAPLCQLWAAWQWGWLPVPSNKAHTSWLTGIQGSLTTPVSSLHFEHIPGFFFPCNGFCQATENSLLTLFLEHGTVSLGMQFQSRHL